MNKDKAIYKILYRNSSGEDVECRIFYNGEVTGFPAEDFTVVNRLQIRMGVLKGKLLRMTKGYHNLSNRIRECLDNFF